jgi:gliding motility-associated-like protein
MAGNSPAPGTGLWTALNGGTITTPASATTTITGLVTAGVYNFVWTITNGSCTSKDTVAITVTTNVIANAGPDQQLCNVTTATLAGSNPSPGAGLWTTTGAASITTPASANSGVTGLVAGNNLFIWTITNGACVTHDTVNIIISSLIASNAGPDQQLCSGTTSTMAANDPSPGSGQWTAINGGVITTSSSATTTITGLTISGTYNFVWTITNGSCTNSDTVAIVVDSIVPANAGPDQQICETQTTATLGATAVGLGAGLWSTTSAAVITDPTNSATTVSNLAAGSYQFIWTVTNSTCQTSDTVTIDVSVFPTVADAGADQHVCFTATGLTLSGNTPTLGSGVWTSLGAATVTTPPAPNSGVSNLQVGNNLFVWTITNGACISTDTMNILVDSNVIANAGPDQQICETQTTATLGATPVGVGTGLWSTTGTAVITDPTDPLSTVSNLAAGSYQFVWTVTNSNCQSTDTMNIDVSQLSTIANAGADQHFCASSATGVIISGNTPVVGSGLWSSLGSATVDTITSPTSTVSNLVVGANVFVWTITNGACVSTDTVIVNVTANPVVSAGPDQFVTSLTPVVIGGSPSASSGTAPFTYVWNPGFGLNDSLLANPTATVNYTQQYLLTVTDSLGCQGVDTMVVYINNPPVALNDTAVICSNDSAIVDVLLNDLDPDTNALTVTVLQGPFSGTASLNVAQQLIYHANAGTNGLDSLQYMICDNGIPSLCDTAWVIITVHVSPTITAVTTNVKCFGDSTGTITATPVGNAPFTFGWSNLQNTQNLDSLFAGTYTLLVTDSFGCTVSLSDTVTGPAAALSATISHQPVSCFGDSTGAIDLQPVGGTTPYSYLWSNTATTQDLSNLVAGIYSVILSDTNGCVFTLSDTIVQPASALNASAVGTDNVCPGDTTASIIVTVSGGTPGYSYLWSNADTTSSILSVVSGIYSVVITDQHFCTVNITDTVLTISPQIVLNTGTVNPFCLGGVLGSIQLNPTGGTVPLHFVWSTADTTSGITNQLGGSYSVVVNDALGCILKDTILLTDTSSLALSNSGANAFCIGDSVVLSVPLYSNVHYQWLLNGGAIADTTTAIVVNQTGDYSVSATAPCGTYNAGPLTITVNSLPTVFVSGDATINCDTVYTISASGGIDYSWSPANLCTTPNAAVTDVNPQVSTFFSVIVTDANGCSATDTVRLEVICDTLFIPTGFSPNGDGINDYFVISHLSKYPNATVQVFNRWGSLVYKKEHYDNTFNGFSNVNLTALGAELPNGTYYVIFDPNNGEKSHVGYVIIRR